MPKLPRLVIATAAAASLTVALAGQPAYAAHKKNIRPVVRVVHRAATPAPRLTTAQARAIRYISALLLEGDAEQALDHDEVPDSYLAGEDEGGKGDAVGDLHYCRDCACDGVAPQPRHIDVAGAPQR